MIGIRILFCLLLVNVGGANGVGEEADNSNGKKDLLFGEMWRKAFEANRHNGKKGEETAKKEVKKEEQTEEEKEEGEKKEIPKGVKKEEEKMVKKEVKEKEEQTEEKEERKLWKKVKREPIDNDYEEEEEERDGEKWKKTIKKEPKIEENISANDQNNSDQSADDDNEEVESESEKLAIVREFEKRRREYKLKNKTKEQHHTQISRQIAKEMGEKLEEIYKWKKEIGTKNKPITNNETKLEIIKKFDRMRNEYKITNKMRAKIEQRIASELGTYRDKIYEWKKELIQKKKPVESEEEKLGIIEEFDRMKKECQMKKDYKRKDKNKIEKEIAKELGISRRNIYKWKNELNIKKEAISKERKVEIIERFEKMRKEHKNENGNRLKFEQKIAKELGTFRNKIYQWKKELINREKKPESEEEKWEIIEQFDSMRNEYKNKKGYKNKNYFQIERKIAKQLGTSRTSIYNWKKELAPLRVIYTREQKRAIIAKFYKLCEQFSNKFNRKPTTIIEEIIAKKFHISRRSIYKWKKTGI